MDFQRNIEFEKVFKYGLVDKIKTGMDFDDLCDIYGLSKRLDKYSGHVYFNGIELNVEDGIIKEIELVLDDLYEVCEFFTVKVCSIFYQWIFL